jgi:hypothetical protein
LSKTDKATGERIHGESKVFYKSSEPKKQSGERWTRDFDEKLLCIEQRMEENEPQLLKRIGAMHAEHVASV